MKVKRFIVMIMKLGDVREYIVNCANAFSAQVITEGLFRDYRVLDVREG